MDKNFQQTVLAELQLLLQPLANAAESEDLRNDLLRALGWDVDRVDGFPAASFVTALSEFAAGYQGLAALVETPPEGLKGLADTLLTTEHIVLGAIALGRVFDGAGSTAPEGFEQLGKELIDHLTVTYLETHHPFAFHLLYLLTVVDDVPPSIAAGSDGTLVRRPVRRTGLRLAQIPSLLNDPVGTLKDEYGLADGITDANASADKLFPRLLFFVEQAGAQGTYGINPNLQVDFDVGEAGAEFAAHTLTVFFPLPDDGDTRTLGTGTGITLSSDLGVVLRPLGTFDFTQVFGRWRSTLHALVQAEGIAIDSDGVLIPAGAAGGIKGELEVARLREPDAEGRPLSFLVGSATGTRLEVGAFAVTLHANLAPDALDFGFQSEVRRAAFVISNGDGDGFLKHVLPAEIPIEFDLAIGWSKLRGLHFSIGAGLNIVLPVHVSLGGVLDIESIELGVRTDGETVDLITTATFTAHIGSVIDAIAQETGLKGQLTFPEETGNLGPLNVGLGFQLPRGIGVAVHAGPVTGGGFIFLDPEVGRYSGALELSVFEVGVKAFGIVDTIFPDGTEGFSFIIVISAEFTPIQLGFGFTLMGVGGLIGVDRTLDAEALGAVVRTGALAHLLFPRNPVADAPAILHDLGTVFPPARGHIVVGPMAKFGWGTPTLISADLGIVLEFPGPRLALLGVARMQLPSPEAALLRLQMALAGVLDFPAKTLAVDAGLFESSVVGFPVSGDMAFRLGFGNKAKFLLSVGGFNPSFDAPPGVPELRRASVDLGVNGNPSLTASGYFALTSNTAQIGAKVELRASGAGIRLHGHLGFDALFVFAPFSFVASFSAGMRVSFHGAGLGVTLRGSLSGPSPWHIKGKVCVSVLWWDACLSVDHKFGRREPAALPEMDPWVGTPEGTDARIAVIGLAEAIADARNWSGSNPPAGFGVVSLAASSTATTTPIDPLGAATLRQKVVPLETEIEKFGEYRPVGHTRFERSLVTINGEAVADNEIEAVEDDFAPAHFFDFDGADKLSMESYVPMEAGFSINANRVDIGSDGSQVMAYKTEFITAEGEKFEDPTTYIPTQAQLRQMLKRSASALGGIRRAGPRKYIVPNRPKKVTLGPKRYVVVDACTSLRNTAITGTGVTQIQALLKLRKHVAANPADRTRFAIAPVHAEL